MKPLHTLSIVEARELLKNRTITAEALADACLARIEELNPEVNAYLEVFADVKEQAKAADARILKGEDAPLLGIPLAIKDNILIKGRVAGAASKMLENYVATYDATVITRLKDAGAIFLGRTNMDEFAMGGSGENSAYGATKNPKDVTRVSGGSSSGSAAAVAGDMCIGAIGSDTGGSVREPAAFCGVVGMKPTYGGISRSGLIAMGSSLDQVSPFGKTVEDAELLYRVMAGFDPKDSTSLPEGAYPKRESAKRIGIPVSMLEGVDADVLENFEAAKKKLTAAGFELVDINLESLKKTLAVYYIIMFAESSTNLSRFDGVKYGLSKKGDTLLADYAESRKAGFGPEVRRRILLGTYVLSSGYYDAYYGRAVAARKALVADFEKAFADVDLVLTPTTPTPAPKLGEKGDPLSMYLMDIFTVTPNLTGMPAMSIPSGTVAREGSELPLGIQLIAPHGAEDMLFAAAKRFSTE